MKAVHKITDIIRLGLTSLTVHKVRSSLTALGIIIGVCGVMASLAINEGMIAKSQEAFRQRGTDNIVINSKKPPTDDTQSATAWMLEYGLTSQDVERLGRNIPEVKRCIMVHRTQQYAHVAEKNLNVFAIATEPSFAKVARVQIVSGRFIGDADMLRSLPTCVITHALATRLFGFDDPLQKTIRMGYTGDPFIIVGVIESLPATLAGEGGDNTNCVIVPLTTDRIRFGEYNIYMSQGSVQREKVFASQVILQMADESSVMDGANIARSVLSRFHNKIDFEVSVPLEQIRMMAEQKKLLTLVSLGIAAISLVVGGIGIMNIMLASVTERTREIGIRRAMGAKRRDIVTQFLVEAVALTMAGGVLGIGLGLTTCWLLGHYNVLQFSPIISTIGIVFPFVMAVFVGLVSGLYPAMRAAMLDPITALRHE